jgi:hypothetical protein
MDIFDFDKYRCTSSEQLETTVYQSDDISRLAYDNLFSLIEDFFNQFCNNHNDIELTFTIDTKSFKENRYLSYAVYQKNRYNEPIYIWFGEVSIADDELPKLKDYSNVK